MENIPFNRPYYTGNELKYIAEAMESGKISGNGEFTRRCQSFLQNYYKTPKALLTNSATDALEMAALLLDIQPGDEVILPAYTFVSTANAFVLRGARPVFADSMAEHPNINVQLIEQLITPRTKAIVTVAYNGIGYQFDYLRQLADKYNIWLIEDAAQAITAKFQNQLVGTFGHLAALSFHETKNIHCGEGGALLINSTALVQRAEILWEKGTNRTAFFRGEIDKYNWLDVGSSFLPSEIAAAFLWAQLEQITQIQAQRHLLWQWYYEALLPLQQSDYLQLPADLPNTAHNAHVFYVVCPNVDNRNALLDYLKQRGIAAVFHYQALNLSPYYTARYASLHLPYAEHYTSCLLRLPLHLSLSQEQIKYIVATIYAFFEQTITSGNR